MVQKQTLKASSFVERMESERGRLEEVITALTERRESIDNLLETYQVTKTSLTEEVQERVARDVPGKKKSIVKIKAQSKGAPKTRGKDGALDKIQVVLRNAAGRTLSKDEIRDGVQKLYGVTLPASWEQMLYRKVRDGKTFYKDNGQFGLIETRARIETVSHVPQTAIA